MYVCVSVMCVCQDVAWLPTLGTVPVGYPCNAHWDMTHRYISVGGNTPPTSTGHDAAYIYEILVLLICNKV